MEFSFHAEFKKEKILTLLINVMSFYDFIFSSSMIQILKIAINVF